MIENIELIILDRDGVINADSSEYIKSPEEWQPIPGSLEAIARLNHAGLKVVVATNQSGISRGYYTLADLEAIHEKMRRELKAVGGELDGIFICPHGPKDNCDCRKPKPGLLWQISRKFNIPPSKILLIGDSSRDIESAKAFGCRFLLVLTGNGEHTLKSDPNLDPQVIFPDLAKAAYAILRPVSDTCV
jgi:D-glycero-D-manno-heptose 1,7-bisphosphate phosphatase